MLWDQGTYDVLGDANATEQLERGDFKFELHGVKLKGSFAIVRMKHAGKGNEWLLIKKKDEHAVPRIRHRPICLEREKRSVPSKR